jgi:hypothetical protein
LILLESIGDFGLDLQTKNYALVKKNHEGFVNTTLEEINNLKKPDDKALKEIFEKYCLQGNAHIFKKILAKHR